MGCKKSIVKRQELSKTKIPQVHLEYIKLNNILQYISKDDLDYINNNINKSIFMPKIIFEDNS